MVETPAESTIDGETVPRDGLPGLWENGLNDAMAGFIVFLIALPLSLGIAMASGAPPIAGVISAIVGGVIASMLSGSYLTINGPAAGLIVIVLGAVNELGGGDPVAGFRYALAVGVIAGLVQVVLGILKAGRLTDFFPLSVVHGMLAGIGVIIMVKQVFPAIGATAPKLGMIHLIESIPNGFTHLNPAIAGIGLVSILIMLGWPLLRYRLTELIPAPLVATMVAVGLGLALDLSRSHTYTLFGRGFELGPQHLVSGLPHQVSAWVTWPDFSHFLSDANITIRYVIMYVFVGSLESLLTASAVDGLDPYGRRSNMNRELVGKGIGNMISSSIGGIPMIAEVVRSKANIMNGARTRWSNFFHGLFMLSFVALAPGVLEHIPLAALAGILVVVGFRLAHPREFAHAWKLGRGEFLAMVATIVLVVGEDLLVGVFAGVIVGLIITLVKGTEIDFVESEGSDRFELRFRGPLTFANYMGIRSRLERVPTGKTLILDFSGSTMIDHTVSQRLSDFEREYQRSGGTVIRRGRPHVNSTMHAIDHPMTGRVSFHGPESQVTPT